MSARKVFRPSQLRKLRACEQVAAVCYRIRSGEIEFLLVRTGGGRWIFPKGGAEPGLTYAQAAALEAYEEAGVHGRIEEVSFTQYSSEKRKTPRSPRKDVVVSAHLCEVLRLSPPQESNRNRTWFSPDKTKRRLSEHRNKQESVAFSRVIDRAVARIRRLGQHPAKESALGVRSHSRDALNRVHLEAPDTGASLASLLRQLRGLAGARATLSRPISLKRRHRLTPSLQLVERTPDLGKN